MLKQRCWRGEEVVVREEEAERTVETVSGSRSGRGALLTFDVGKLAFVYCHRQRPHVPRLDLGLSNFGLSGKLLFQERQGGFEDLLG